jgi:hypothetical protein
VRADIRPRSEYRGSFVQFVRRFGRGHNSIRLSDERLTPGRWTLRLQGTNWIASGGIAVTDVRVAKRR